MGYLRTSLARAQTTRSVVAPASQHTRIQSTGKHEITAAWTTPPGIASSEVSVSPPRQAAVPMACTAETVSETPGRVQPPERQGHNITVSGGSPPSIRLSESAAAGASVPTKAQHRPAVTIPGPVNVREEDFSARTKMVTLDLRDRPRTPIPEMNRRSTPGPAETVVSVANENLRETQSATAPTQNSLPVPSGRTEGAKTPVFHVNWLEGNRSIPQAAREKVEREVVRLARAEFPPRAEAARSEQPSVEIRVEHLTVKIENPTTTPSAPPSASRRTTPAGSAPDFSDYFLRRSISGF
jgi:hypothetical protein